jgi:hypothetical protein
MIEHQKNREQVVCADGFKVSIQASEFHYCSPKVSGIFVIYTSVELADPNEEEELIAKWQESPKSERPTYDVYPYVPAEIVSMMIAKHGGMVKGECPKLGYIASGETLEMPIMKGAAG